MAKEPIPSSIGLIRWPHLGAPRQNPQNPEAEPRFAATFVGTGENAQDAEFISQLKQQMNELCTMEFGRPVKEFMEMCQQHGQEFVVALKANNDPKRAKHDGIGRYPQGFHFEATTKFSPQFFDPQGQQIQFDPQMFYDGVVARVWVSPYKWEHAPTKRRGIGLNLHGVQFARHGQQLGGAQISAGAVGGSDIPGNLPEPNAPQVSDQNAGAQEQTPPPGQPGGAPAPGGQSFGFDGGGQQQQQPPAQNPARGNDFGF